MKKYSIDQGFLCWDEDGPFVSPRPAAYYLEVEGEEYTFLIRPEGSKDSVRYSGTFEDEEQNKLIVFIGTPFVGLIDWVIQRYRDVYRIIPDLRILRNLFNQAGIL